MRNARICVYMTVLLCFSSARRVRAQNIQTFAGGGPDHLPAIDANIAQPGAVVVDGSGNTYIAAANQDRVFKVDPRGQLTAVAGTGTPGFSGDGGPATSAILHAPAAVAVDRAGNIYISDAQNLRVRKVDPSGIITTVAGNGNYCYPSTAVCGDGGAATDASLGPSLGVAVDDVGNLYIADTFNNRIRKVDASGIITTAAGNGTIGFSGDGGLATSASLSDPVGVSVDSNGNLYIADSYNNRIRKVDTWGTISTVAGNENYCSPFGDPCGDGGLATNASLGVPQGLAVDTAGDIYIADSGSGRIRKVDTSGMITTVAGTGLYAYSGDGGLATSANLNFPDGVAVDSDGNLYIADTFNNRIRKVDASGIITTAAGNGTLLFSGEDVPATGASITVVGERPDSAGNLYIADTVNNRIREVDISGTIKTLVGNGDLCYVPTDPCGDGGLATSASLNRPSGVSVDRAGNVYVADSGTSRIRKVDTSGIITTVAGNGTRCNPTDPCGDGEAAASANLDVPFDVVVGTDGTLYISEERRVRKVDTSGIITTVAGNGTSCLNSTDSCGDGGPATSASLSYPSPGDLAVDSAGNLYIADTWINRIRRVDTLGIITTVAGNGTSCLDSTDSCGDGGPATSASLNHPSGVSVDRAGNLYIADTWNGRIRKVDTSGIITTVAGDGDYGFSGDGGPATSAMLAYPLAVAVSGTGDIFIADSNNERVRVLRAAPEVSLSPLNLDFGHLQAGTQSLPKTVTVTNTGTAELHVSNVSVTSDFLETDNCNSGPVQMGDKCTISVSFLPTAIGSRTGTLTLTDDAADSPQSLELSGVGDYGFVGLLSPYQPPSAGVAYKINSTIPLKWQYENANGSVVASSDFEPTVQISFVGACGVTDTTAITVSDAGSSGYQYDSTSNTWQFNWKTIGLPRGCYDISVQTAVTGQSNGGFQIQLK